MNGDNTFTYTSSDTELDYNLEEVQSSIDIIQKNLNDMQAIQSSIQSYLNGFKETWTSSGSANVFNNLENFVSPSNEKSMLTSSIREVDTLLKSLESALARLESIDKEGSL